MGKVHAILLASGEGERAGYHLPKQFIKIAGKTLIEHTIEVFEKNPRVDDVIIIINPLYTSLMEDILLRNDYRKVQKVLQGGKSRRESSYIGLQAINDDNDKVLIHDAVRPFLRNEIIDDCIDALDSYDSVDVAIPSPDTIIEVNEESRITGIPQRERLRRGQTPQGFRTGVIKKAHEMAMASENEMAHITDDCGLILKFDLGPIYVVQGEERNIKITYPEDIFLADKIFQTNSYSIQEEIPLEAIEGKVVVIFGGSKGIGEATAEMAGHYGARVHTFSRGNGTDVTSFTDVSDALEQVYRKEGRIDYVVNSAGVLRIGKLNTRDIEDIVEEININYIGSITVAKASVQYLKKSQGGIVLYTSSSYTRGRALYSVYSSSKAAIVNLTQALAEELMPSNIKVNVINPERTDTPMRRENFGKEPKETLLTAGEVAEASLKTMLSGLSGQVIDVRRKQ
ncbi:MAG TPA: 2-C-methyl-D-erythritol 4-phosphate cytidylyltransferase [Bacillales bacterium]